MKPRVSYMAPNSEQSFLHTYGKNSIPLICTHTGNVDFRTDCPRNKAAQVLRAWRKAGKVARLKR